MSLSEENAPVAEFQLSSAKESMSKDLCQAPNDPGNGVYWFIYFLGLVILLPWNILITVNGYWDYKFRNVTLDGGKKKASKAPCLTFRGLVHVVFNGFCCYELRTVVIHIQMFCEIKYKTFPYLRQYFSLRSCLPPQVRRSVE